jgi:hypothetical protein
MPSESALLNVSADHPIIITRKRTRTQKFERVDVIGYPGEPLRSSPLSGDIIIRLVGGGPGHATVIAPPPTAAVPLAQSTNDTMRGLTDSAGRLLDDLVLLRLAMPPATSASMPPVSATTDSDAEDIGDGSPFLSQALDQCWSNTQDLQRTLPASSNPSRASRLAIGSESRVSVDANPYATIGKDQLEAIVRASFTSSQMPHTLLALWAKEGSLRMTTSAVAVPAARSAENARSLLRSQIYYEQLGSDHFVVTRYDAAAHDNVWDNSDGAASKHEAHFRAQVAALVSARTLSRDISDAINAELTVAAGPPLSVTPSIKFYALTLLLMDALFTQMQNNPFAEISPISGPMNYMQWNIGIKRFQEFLASAERHRKEPAFRQPSGDPIGLEQWALHTVPAPKEWFQPRVNAIRFMYYQNSYQSIFASPMNLIKPGIEDLSSNRDRG